MSGWHQPPPVLILSGSDEFLRNRELRDAISVSDEIGRTVEYLEGDDREGLSRTLSSTGVLFDETVLAVVSDPEDVDVDLVLRHHEFGGTLVCLLLHQPGTIKAKSNLAKIAAELPPNLVAKYETPKPWEETPRAVAFCVAEAQRQGIVCGVPLAEGLVQHVGADLGMLSFEILKLRLFLGVEGVKEATPAHLRRTLGAFSELGPKPVVEALEARDVQALGKALANMRRTHAGDMGSAVLRTTAFVGHSATSWLHAAALTRSGCSPEEVAEKTGTHIFVLRKSTLPAARRWGEENLISLIKAVARVSRAVKSGHTSPWVELECALFRSLTSSTQALKYPGATA